METKTKLIILAGVVSVLLIAGGIYTALEFNKTQDEAAQKVQSKKIKEVKKEKQKPVLELTQDVVELEVGAVFNYVDFIKRAEDENGFNLKDNVTAPAKIPTEEPGEYKVEYTFKLRSGKTIRKELKVIVMYFEKSTTPDDVSH